MSDAWWCQYAVIGGRVAESVRVTVADGRFATIDITTAAQPDDVRLQGLTIPGLANAHSHAFHRALRSRTQADGGTFWTWRELMYRAAERLDPDSYFRLARATYAEMALAGITTVGEFHYLHHRPGGSHYGDANAMGLALLAAASEAGIRITLLDTLYLHGGLDRRGHVDLEGVQRRFGDGTVDAWINRVGEVVPADGQRIGGAIHSVRAVDPAAMGAVGEWAISVGAPLHAHVSEQVVENEQCARVYRRSPTEVFEAAGVLDASFTAIHATHLRPDDIALLGSSSVCICPTTERDLGDGIGPVRELVDAGATLTVGSDSHAVIDLFEEARAVELDERLRSMERGRHHAAALLDAATVDGHRSLGWDDVGAIDVGQRADLVTVTLESVRTAGADPALAVEAVVFGATASDVTSVIVDGRVVVEDGRHVGIDVADELHRTVTALMDEG